MAFVDDYALALNPGFVRRVQVALVKAALAVRAEAVPAAAADKLLYNRRQDLAARVLAHPDAQARELALAVVKGAAIIEASTDGDIEFSVASIWTACSPPVVAL